MMATNEPMPLSEMLQPLLMWAGYHRGHAITEEALPRFHEIVDELDKQIAQLTYLYGQQVYPSHKKLETALTLLESLAKDEPAGYGAESSIRHCAYCEASEEEDYPIQHAPECPWLQARAFLAAHPAT